MTIRMMKKTKQKKKSEENIYRPRYEKLNNNELKFKKKIPSIIDKENNSYLEYSSDTSRKKRYSPYSKSNHRKNNSRSRSESRQKNGSKFRHSHYDDRRHEEHHHHHRHRHRHKDYSDRKNNNKIRNREEEVESMRREILQNNSISAFLQGKSSNIFYDDNYLPISSNPYKYLGKPGLEDNYFDKINEIPVSMSDICKKDFELYVINLPHDLTEEQIKELLNAALISIEANEKKGEPITKVTKPKNGKYFILEFRTRSECKNALKLNGMKILNRTLKIGQPNYLNEKEPNNFNNNINNCGHLEAILRDPPDVVISDIRMPALSGLDLLAAIREAQLPVEVVLVSAFADFAYAQEAISRGAFQYLLKPVKKAELEDCLTRLRTLLAKKGQQQAQEENLHRRSLLLSAKTVGEAAETLLDPEFFSSVFFVANLHGTSSFPAFSLPETVCACIPLEIGNAVLLGSTSLSPDQLFEQIMASASDLRIGLICTSRPEEEMASLLYRAQLARKSAVFLGQDGYLEKAETEHPSWDELLTAVRYAHADVISSHLKTLEKAVRDMQLPPDRLFHLLHRMQESSGKTILAEEVHTVHDMLRAYPHADLLFAHLHHVFLSGEENAALLRVMREIQENFAAPQTIASLAQEMRMSQAALSQLVKKHTEKTYSELISEKRLEKACEYLTYSGESIVRIAELTGYSDQFYFSKQFKRAFGESPKAYRKRTQKTN